MKKSPSKRLWTVLTSVFAVFLVIAIVATVVANSFASSINGFLGVDTFKVISEGGEGENTNYYPSAWSDEEFDAHQRDVCIRVEAEGAVLLKNDNNALPLAQGAKISAFSHSSVDIIYGGTGSGSVDTSTAPTLKDALESEGLQVNPTLWDFYATGDGSKYVRSATDIDGSGTKGEYKINEVPWSAYPQNVVSSVGDYGAAAIFVLSRSGGEGGDLWRTGTDGENGDYLALSQEEKDTLAQLGALKEVGIISKVIVLINSSNAVHCSFLDDPTYGIDAALWIGGVGQYGLYGVAQILSGTVNPSGRLVDTFCYDNMTAPAMQNFGDFSFPNAKAMGLTQTDDVTQNNTYYVVYQEGIYVGYKYYETRYEDTVLGQGNTAGYNYSAEVAYPFGFGLSYTSFDYSVPTVEDTGEAFSVTVEVTNTGDAAGKEVVQVYLQKPYTSYDVENHIEKASVELVGFEKTDLLNPGQSQTVTVSVPKNLLRSYDAYNSKTYIVEAGDYYLSVGRDAHNAVNNILLSKGAADSALYGEGSADLAKVVSLTAAQADELTQLVSVGASGNDITNQFEDTDLNTYDGYDGSITYLSRSDWQGTFPKPLEIVLTDKFAADIINEFQTRSGYEMPKYGQTNNMMMANFISKDYDDPEWELLLDQMTFDEQVTLITNSFHNTKVITSIQKPATKETNGPQGITDSFITGKSSGMAFPAEVIMAATWNREIMKEIGECIGEQGLKSNTHGVYGPAANIHRTAYSGRNYEYYSEDGFLSGAMAVPEVAAIESKGVYVLMKHIALNDQETHRAGITTWSNEQAIREIYLVPYEMATVEANVHGFMTVMNRIGAKWGGAHEGLLTNVIRGEWGFEGFVITDCTVNSTYTDSLVGLQGGSDIWDGVKSIEQTDESLYANQNDPYVCQLMRQAVHRLLYVQVNSSVMNGISSHDRVVEIMTWWQITLIVVDVVFGVLTLCSIVMLVIAVRQKKQRSEK